MAYSSRLEFIIVENHSGRILKHVSCSANPAYSYTLQGPKSRNGVIQCSFRLGLPTSVKAPKTISHKCPQGLLCPIRSRYSRPSRSWPFLHSETRDKDVSNKVGGEDSHRSLSSDLHVYAATYAITHKHAHTETTHPPIHSQDYP